MTEITNTLYENGRIKVSVFSRYFKTFIVDIREHALILPWEYLEEAEITSPEQLKKRLSVYEPKYNSVLDEEGISHEELALILRKSRIRELENACQLTLLSSA